MNIWFNEVIERHIAIEAWLSQAQGDVDLLLSHFTHDFQMIGLSGAKLDFSALQAFFNSHGGKRPGLTIAIDELTLINHQADSAVVQYREVQRLPGQPEHVRRSCVVLQEINQKIVWRYLQETTVTA